MVTRGVLGAIVVGAALATAAAPAMASDGQWSGLYLGANLGWAGTSYSSELQGFPGNLVSGDHDSAIGGLHVGVQHQVGQFVFGLEGSYSGAGAFSSFGDAIPGGTADCLGVNVAGGLFSCQARLHNLFTLGPRVGWAPSSQWLLYATGGWATGRITDRVTLNSTGATAGQTNESHDGWFVGGGVEYALTKNWIVGLEYMHIDFDSRLRCEIASLGGCPAGESRNGFADTDVVRARLSFKLGRVE